MIKRQHETRNGKIQVLWENGEQRKSMQFDAIYHFNLIIILLYFYLFISPFSETKLKIKFSFYIAVSIKDICYIWMVSYGKPFKEQ